MSSKQNGTGTAQAAQTEKETPTAEMLEKAAIEKFKRSGEFDVVRKSILRDWETSDDGVAFKEKLRKIVETEIKRDHTLQARDRGKAATLVGGVVERTQLYPEVKLAAAKNIFRTDAFQKQIYDALKKYYPESASTVPKNEDDTGNEDASKRETPHISSAQAAAMSFIQREQGH